MYQGNSLATCWGGNITSLSERTSWSTMAVSTRVGAALGVVAHWEVVVDVHMALKLGESFMEPVCFHVVFDALEGFIFLFDLCDDGSAVNFELTLALVVAAVSLDFSIGGWVFESVGCFSQS